MSYDPGQFAEKYQLSLESARQDFPRRGTCGIELELNLLDSELRPLLTVGSGPSKQSFVDYLRETCIPPSVRDLSGLEAFQWMIEWATRPYYSARGVVYESRVLEAVVVNALHKAGRSFGERLHAWHGNLLYLTRVGHDSIPGSWHLAKRRYLERCVDQYGDALATAGNHINLSLPEPLLAWDFMHLPATERGNTHLDNYKNQVYVTAARLMRAFAPLFIAASAASPFQAQVRAGRPVVALTENDSVRSLTFPNPPRLDVPDLYRSHQDYLQISYDLVRRGLRFGNNNWTPVRARSLEERVERLIEVTSEQLEDMYARGLYAAGEAQPPDEMARQIEIQNLLARIDLPMSRVEVRTDDGGNPLDLEIANLGLKNLLLMRFYADPEFARAFRYDREDISRARRNERLAAQHGLRAEIENPFTGKPVGMRAFLRWTLDEIRPLAEALEMWSDLTPLVEMAAGAPNTAQRLRAQARAGIGAGDEVPLDLLKELVETHEAQVSRDAEHIASSLALLDGETEKLGEILYRLRSHVRKEPQAPIRFRPQQESLIDIDYPDKTSEIVDIARRLIRIPSVTACPAERLDEVHRAAVFVFDYLRNHGLEARFFDQHKYPAILAGFPGQQLAPVMLGGHFDVVAPEPDDSQFDARIVGDYLWGRGAGDMKTVVATYMVWMKDALRQGPPYPPVSLLLVGNEENGESEPAGTPHVLQALSDEAGYAPELFIAGERTEERGDGLWGEICTQNRGVMRFDVVASGQRGHSGITGAQADLTQRLILARAEIQEFAEKHFTLQSPDKWRSQVRFPFIQVGAPGIYNITADQGLLGVEVRTIPQDDLEAMLADVRAYCEANALEMLVSVMEGGVACNPENPYLQTLVAAVEQASGAPARLGRKLPGTSARFAPGGQGVVWGQSGVGPHSSQERHYIPSILPYYQALDAFGQLLLERGG